MFNQEFFMKYRSLSIILFIFIISAKSNAEVINHEIRSLTAKEQAVIAKIKKYYPNFLMSNKVRTYYKVNNQTKVKLPIYSDMIFKRVDDLVNDEFVSYTVSFEYLSNSLAYTFDGGTAFRGYGNITIAGEKVIKTEFGCGRSACSVNVYVNGKEINI